MKLQDSKDRTLYAALLSLIVLACLTLLGQLRGFFFDIWNALWTVLLPLLISIIATYVLRPIVDSLTVRRVPRTVGILLVYFVFAILTVILLQNVLPLLTQQISTFIRQLPGYVATFDGLLDRLSFATRVLPNGVRMGLEKAIGGVETSLVTGLSQTLIGVKDLLGGAVTAFVIPFLVFYLLKDYSLFTNLVVRWFPPQSRATAAGILAGIDHSLGKYVRGQLLVMALVGTATFIGLLMVRMPYALLLSLVVALTNIIPYLGPFIGAAPALFMALGISHALLIKVLLVNLIVQQLEGNVFSPWIMGKTMDLHPLLILLAVLLAGEVAGVTGLIFAVPIVAVSKVIYEQIRRARSDA
ncbi:MAG: AI-2E family transporter [Bacilli bacterium]